MQQHLARLCYFQSLGFDNSEGLLAYSKEQDRLKLLEKRIGKNNFSKFRKREKNSYDPMAHSIWAVPFFFILVLPISMFFFGHIIW